jgi:hypothetical protein
VIGAIGFVFERLTADPGPPQSVTVPRLQRTAACARDTEGGTMKRVSVLLLIAISLLKSPAL